jgi:arylsulfatase A-like enzyme
LVVHVPGAEPRRIAERRSIIDLAPTILDIFKLPMPSGEGDDFMSGKSLIYDVFMPPGYSPEKRIVFVDMAAGPNNADRQAFIENDYKLVTSMSRPLGLYHLKADPEERKDLLDDKELAGGIMDRFKAFKRTLREVKVRPTE